MLPGQLTPRPQEHVVRLGTWMPCAQAAEMRAFFAGVTIAPATARRTTEAAGMAYEAVRTAAVEATGRQLPPGPPSPRVQLLRVGGALVPLRHWERPRSRP